MCPWPLTETEGIQNPRGLVAAGSNSVPDCTSDGVPVRLVISCQREPLRPPVPEATPLVLTWIFCAVQRLDAPVILFLWIAAANSRSSRESSRRFAAEPLTGCRIGKVVVGMVSRMFPEIEGVP